ncbi:MAG TPA: 23S rRNA (adenine(2503)-C(2))-methyltransferase RlmN [Acidimicrobiia bacterium]|nr:23S rRNA (adenine(2503)-C(2))-methyltransferase RlmN [Acidimicrobiia bacterium]
MSSPASLSSSPYLPDPESLGELLAGHPGYRAKQLLAWLYRTPVLDAGQMSNLPAEIRTRWADGLYPFSVEIEQSADRGRTRKWLFRTPDGKSIEAVLMGYPRRTTLCISSQAGCAMACTFCATGQFGFERHLEAGEIAAQVAFANAQLRARPMEGSPSRVTNVVFMGMGEPLANYPRVRESLRRMIEVMGIGARSFTVSTVGVVPGMRRLAEDPWQVNLAVSLHAADDDLRSTLVPLNDRYPLADVIAAARNYTERKGRRVSIEWTLISGSNDSDDQAVKLATIARNLAAHVNVIALNPTPLTADRPPNPARIDGFMKALIDAGANATLRDTRGQDIDAACGQLRIRSVTEQAG